MMSTSFFSNIQLANPDPVFGLQNAYTNDTNENKINLGIGAYRDENGKPWVLPVVKKAKEIILNDTNMIHEYLPIGGIKEYWELAIKLMVGNEWFSSHKDNVTGIQTLSGTGALKIASDFIAKFLPGTEVLISKPSWGNHKAIFSNSGLKTSEYRYWDAKNLALDINGMLEDLDKAPNGSLIILHACAHNPTGVDPTQEQWSQIYEVIKRKGHLALFDSAYQGFASGDLEKDAFAVRFFIEKGAEVIICQSFAKNFGLYGERTGALSFVSSNTENLKAIKSQIELLVRSNYSNPPKFGALIVQTVLSDEKLFAEWKENLKTMSGRINSMRNRLFEELKKRETPGDWSHIINQIGMFSYTGLNGM